MKVKTEYHLDDINLDNIHQKINLLKKQVKADTQQEFQAIKRKILKKDREDYSAGQPVTQVSSQLLRQEGQDVDHQSGNQNQQNMVIGNQHPYQLGEYNIARIQDPVSYKNIKLVDEIDYERIKDLSKKKISAYQAAEYIKYTLAEQIEEKIQEVWQELEDGQNKVDMDSFFKKISKMGVHFTQATAISIPILKKNINLKKVLFELTFKRPGSKITWSQLKSSMQNYVHQSQPSIDILINKFKKQKTHIQSNHFNIPPEVVVELKNIYKKCVTEQFICFSSVKGLALKILSQLNFEKYMKMLVRPKSHYEPAITVKQTIEYMKKKAPYYVDLDQFLLFFTVHPYAYYAVQERQCLGDDSTMKMQQNYHKKYPRGNETLARVKSTQEFHQHSSSNRKIPVIRTSIVNQYMLSKNNPNSIRNRKLKEDLIELEEKRKPEEYKFKARPFSKSHSEEKYRQFMTNLNEKKKRLRQKELLQHKEDEKQVERLKKQTKLFVLPEPGQPQFKHFTFSSKPVPEVCITPKLQEIESNKNERREKLFSEAKFKYFRSWQELPHVATIQKEEHTILTPRETPQYSSSSHQIPDYKAEQQRMKYELQVRRLKFKPTEAQEFYFHTKARHPHEYKLKQESYHYEPSYDYKEIIYSPEPEIYYTQKFTDMVVANKSRALMKEQKEKEKMEKQRQRRNKHKNFAKFMKNPMSRIPDTAKICELEAKAKIQRHKKHWKNLDREYEEQLNEMYSNVIKRPFLYQKQSTSRNKQYIVAVISPKNSNNNKKKKVKRSTKSQQVNRSF